MCRQPLAKTPPCPPFSPLPSLPVHAREASRELNAHAEIAIGTGRHRPRSVSKTTRCDVRDVYLSILCWSRFRHRSSAPMDACRVVVLLSTHRDASNRSRRVEASSPSRSSVRAAHLFEIRAVFTLEPILSKAERNSVSILLCRLLGLRAEESAVCVFCLCLYFCKIAGKLMKKLIECG